MISDSVLLPPFSCHSHPSLSSFSIKISNRKSSNAKSDQIFEENLHSKKSQFNKLSPPLLPHYYYTSTFPSLYATVSPTQSKASEGNEEHHLHNRSRNLNSSRSVSNKSDAINPSVTCASDPLKKTSWENSYSEKSSPITDNTKEENKPSEQEKSSTKSSPKKSNATNEFENLLTKDNSTKLSSQVFSTATSDGHLNRVMSLSNENSLVPNGPLFRRRRHSCSWAHVSTSPVQKQRTISPVQRPKLRPATSMSLNEPKMGCPVFRPTSSNLVSKHDNNVNKKNDNAVQEPNFTEKRLCRREINNCFERYYSAQIQNDKKKINQTKISHNFLPKQTHWAHSNDSTMLSKRTDFSQKNSNKIKTCSNKSLQKLKDLKITTENTKKKKLEHSNEEYRKNKIKVENERNCFQEEKLVAFTNQKDPSENSFLNVSKITENTQQEICKPILTFAYASPTPLTSPEQLIIRDSVEKVRKWIRNLPEEFDAIQ